MCVGVKVGEHRLHHVICSRYSTLCSEIITPSGSCWEMYRVREMSGFATGKANAIITILLLCSSRYFIAGKMLQE